MLKIATLLAALIATGALASNAQAHGAGGYYTSYAYRMQGRPKPEKQCDKERRFQMEQVASARRAQSFRAMKAKRATQAAEAAAAKRTRLAAIRQPDALSGASAKQVSAQSKSSAPAVTNATPSGTAAASRGDLLPGSVNATKAAETTKVASETVCRKFSATADGLIDVPCN